MLNQAIYVRLLILFCAFSTVQRIKLSKINVEVSRLIIATSIRVYSKVLANIAAQNNEVSF
jgi:ABC-type Zn uptake system ZnuABC Zn-binding protein ZnuA